MSCFALMTRAYCFYSLISFFLLITLLFEVEWTRFVIPFNLIILAPGVSEEHSWKAIQKATIPSTAIIDNKS